MRAEVVPSGGRFLAPAVAESVAALGLAGVDSAAVRLAERLAAAIDAAGPEAEAMALEKLSGRLLAVLVELGATPRARAQAGKPVSDGTPTKLAQLRAAVA